MKQIQAWGRKAVAFGLLLILGLSLGAVSYPKPQPVQRGQGRAQESAMMGSVTAKPSSQEEVPSYCKERTNDSNGLEISAAAMIKGISLTDLMGGALIGLIKPLLGVLCSGYTGITNQFGGGDAEFLYGTGRLLTYDNVAVRNLWNYMAVFAGALLALLIALAGVQMMMGRSPRVLLPRLLFAFIAIFAFWEVLPKLIDLETLLSHEILQVAILEDGGTKDVVAAMTQGHSIFDVVDGIGAFWFAIAVVVILSFFLLLEMLARIGLLDLLIVLSGPMVLCYWHPAWQRWANTWLSLFLVTLFVQPVQLLAIALAIGLMNTLGSGTLISVFVGIVVLFMVLKIPGWVNSTVGHAFGTAGDAWSAFKRDVMQTVTFAIRVMGFVGGGPAGGAAAGAGGGFSRGGSGSSRGRGGAGRSRP